MAEEPDECNRQIVARASRAPGNLSLPYAGIGEPSRGCFSIGFAAKASWQKFSSGSDSMRMTPDELFARLAELGITVSTVSHPPLFTVADSQALRGEIPGGHTKNLFLKDKKGNFFLITLDEDAAVDLKQIHQLIGASSRVSFGSPEALMQLLGVMPGAVTAFGLVNDKSGMVKFVIDESLLEHETINAHPLTNEATTSIASLDLLRFARATGHEPLILKVSGR